MSKKREHHKLCMVGANAPFQYTEAYKSLRTNLEFLSATDDCKTILVTSCSVYLSIIASLKKSFHKK